MNTVHPNPVDAQRRAADPSASVWVGASAGTGKTKVLTDRVLSLMLTGTLPQRILCLTFTKAAAAEMSTRIAQQLGLWAQMPDEDLINSLEELTGQAPDDATTTRARRLFARVLDTPGGMNIQTIHAFCQSLLSRFPLEAEIAPHFSVMDERDAEEMLAAAMEELLADAGTSQNQQITDALSVITRHVREDRFVELMKALSRSRGRVRRLIGQFQGIENVVSHTWKTLGLSEGETPANIKEKASGEDSFDQIGLRLTCEALVEGSKTDLARGEIIANWLTNNIEDRVKNFENYADAFLTYNQTSIRKTLITKGTVKKFPGTDVVLETEAFRLLAVSRQRSAAVTAEATSALLYLGDMLINLYGRQKISHALLDYDDLIFGARDLLQKDGIAPWVLFKLDGGLEHILVDEAQDTNPEQWEVIKALAEEFFSGAGAQESTRTIFAVGDTKQSIYSFQGAAPEAFGATRDYFAEKVGSAEGVWRHEDLNISFRSTTVILNAVDFVFSQPGISEGVSLDGLKIQHDAWRKNDGGAIEIWPPIEPLESDAPAPWKPPVERIPGDSPEARLAALIAEKIHAMIENGNLLESKGRAVSPGDIIILVRRRRGFTDALVRELKQRNVAVAGVDRMVLTEQLAVMDLIALGRFLLLPEDNLTLATVLKSPLIGITEDQLFTLAYNRENSLWRELYKQQNDDPAFLNAYTYLSSLLSRTDFESPFELFSHVLGPLNGRRLLLERLGQDADDPINEFLDQALTFERTHVASLEGFLHWVEAGGIEVKRDLEQGGQNAVRIMTVHGAKGLQAPIVFLPDTMQTPTQNDALLWPDLDSGQLMLWAPRREWYEDIAEAELEKVKQRQDQEYRRLLYVAMTRAEDRLYVCGWHGARKPSDDCWYNLIRRGLEAMVKTPSTNYAVHRETPESDILRLICPQVGAPEKSEAIEPITDFSDGIRGWMTDLPSAESTPPKPLTPSRPEGDTPPVQSPFGKDDGHRFKRGRIIHRLLQTLPDLPPDAQEGAARSFLAQSVHVLNLDEQNEIALETLAILNHAEFSFLFGPGSQAEVPMVGEIDGRGISAQLDRLLVTNDAVYVIDYKTNRPPPKRPEDIADVYLKQMSAYRLALQRIYPELPIRCLLLWSDGPSLMELPEALLGNI
jgi:ATP-dependent helicase/nuclease subunit A